MDVLITTPVEPSLDRAILDRAGNRGIPVIAESVGMSGAATLVAVDNYQAGAALGRWAGRTRSRITVGGRTFST